MEIKGWQRKGRRDADKETIQTHTCSLFFIQEGFDWVMSLHSDE